MEELARVKSGLHEGLDSIEVVEISLQLESLARG